MSTELQRQTDVTGAEIVSAEMIDDAVANCFASIGDAPGRALELVTPEEVAALDDADADPDGEGAHLRYLADLLIDRLRRGSGGMSLTEEVGSYRGFKVIVHVSGDGRFAHHSTLFGYNAEVRLCAGEGGNVYVAQIGESNVGITQSIDYQLRHLEDRLEQARAGLKMLGARLETVKAEVDKPWAHAAEYRRLRSRYGEMGVALQSEGIEVESNTTFTAEDGDGDDDSCEGAPADTEEQATAAPVDDELSARHNPFTGLEEYPIVVDEAGADGDESDDARETESGTSDSGLFDFEGGLEITAAESEDTDIFAAPAGGDNEDDDAGCAGEAAGEVFRASPPAATKPVRPRAVKNVKQPKGESQIGFAW